MTVFSLLFTLTLDERLLLETFTVYQNVRVDLYIE
jgi:hypothetical protein